MEQFSHLMLAREVLLEEFINTIVTTLLLSVVEILALRSISQPMDRRIVIMWRVL